MSEMELHGLDIFLFNKSILEKKKFSNNVNTEIYIFKI